MFFSCKQAETDLPNEIFIDSTNKAIPPKVGELPISPVKNGTFLGNEQRNYYGDSSANHLNVLWQTYLGSGSTNLGKKGVVTWQGAGWTGQPLLFEEDSNIYIIQGCYDHSLKKINAKTGEIKWVYFYEDVLKGTGTIYEKLDSNKTELTILQGSRLGLANSLSAKNIYSFRAVDASNGAENWRMNVERGPSYSRDVDGSALILNDTAYLGLENGYFVVFSPYDKDTIKSKKDTHYEPKMWAKHPLFNSNDKQTHLGNLVTESSPCRIGNYIYIASGSGHLYGYNIAKDTVDWDLEIGSDINGSAVVTNDSCLLVPIEKQYIKGKGGVMKVNPRLNPEEAIVWFMPSKDKNYSSWKGGVIGSPSTNASYNQQDKYLNLACFAGIDGNLYLIEHDIVTDSLVFGPNNKNKYPIPRLLDKKYIGPTISTPIMVENKIIAAGYQGLYLFEINENYHLIEQDYFKGFFESTPVVNNGHIFIASRNGYLYCFGDSLIENPVKIKQSKEEILLLASQNNPTKDVKEQTSSVPIKKEISKNAEEESTNIAVQKQEAIIQDIDQGKVYIIIGTFREKQNAHNLKNKCQSKFKDAGIFEKKGLYYVYTNEFSSSNEANKIISNVRQRCDCKVWLFTKSLEK